jgi:RHS repeat-associated protein
MQLQVGSREALQQIMFARYYSSSLARFTSVDPLMSSANPMLPQSWNRYSYAWNNPVLLFDPTGEVVQLTGKTEEERQQELNVIKHSLHDDEAASQLSIEEVTNEDGSTSYQVAIQGDAQAFSESSPTAAVIGEAIGSKNTIEFGFGSKTETVATGGGNSRITINPNDAGRTISGVTQTYDTMTQHEFGHGLGIAKGTYQGRPIFGPPSQLGTNPEALAAENMARAWYVQKAKQQYGEGSQAARSAGILYGKPRESH